MALLTKIRLLAVKHEATLGTGIATTVADIEAFDVQYSPSIEMISREGLGSMSAPADVVGQRSGTVTFKTYLKAGGGGGAGTAPLFMERLMPMCSYVQALEVFSPSSTAPAVTSTAPTTGTVSSYENGLQKTISGAMGTCKLMLNAGQPAVFEWTFTGRYEGVAAAAPVVDAALTTQTIADTGLPMKWQSSTITIAGALISCVESLTIDLGNQVVLRPCASSATGFSYAIVTGRRVTGSWNPEARLVATKDVHALWLAGTAEALSLTLTDGSTTCTIAAPKAQRTNIQPGDRNGIQVDQIDFLCHKSAAAGNDELTFTFS